MGDREETVANPSTKAAVITRLHHFQRSLRTLSAGADSQVQCLMAGEDLIQAMNSLLDELRRRTTP
jgi:hypothetical protein